jgi:AraC-like DNA-binding protein
MTAMVRASGLRGYRDLVRSLGGDPGPLLRRHGLSLASLAEEDALIPLQAQIGLLESTATALKCSDFGLRLARTQDIGILGPLAIAMQSAATVADAAVNASRYLFVHSTGVAFTVFQHSPDHARYAELRYEILLARSPLARQWIDMALGFTHRVILLLAPDRYRLAEVRLPHRPEASATAYLRFFGATILTEQPHAALILTRNTLDAPMRSANRELQRMAIHYLDTLFPDSDQGLARRVQLAISSRLGTGQIGRDSISRLLCIHPRTLQRRLSEEGTTFDAVRDSACREAAWRYLASTDLPFIRVAALVGLARQSALTRACRRWFGATPGAVRKRGAPQRRSPPQVHPPRSSPVAYSIQNGNQDPGGIPEGKVAGRKPSARGRNRPT